MQNEVWKDIPNYEGMYQVSNFGNVKSLSRKICNHRGCYISKEIILKYGIDKKGYKTVALCKESKLVTFRVHKLVAITFLNHIPCGYKLVIDHIDENPLNNNVENLQLITQRENAVKSMNKKSKRRNTLSVWLLRCWRMKKRLID